MSTSPDSCTWTVVKFDETFYTQCGVTYEFSNGNVDDNDFTMHSPFDKCVMKLERAREVTKCYFCPFCGGKIISNEATIALITFIHHFVDEDNERD